MENNKKKSFCVQNERKKPQIFPNDNSIMVVWFVIVKSVLHPYSYIGIKIEWKYIEKKMEIKSPKKSPDKNQSVNMQIICFCFFFFWFQLLNKKKCLKCNKIHRLCQYRHNGFIWHFFNDSFYFILYFSFV